MKGRAAAIPRPSSGREEQGGAAATVRRIGAGTATLLVVASMIGTGVFTTTGLLVRDLGSPAAVLVAWAAGGIVALCGALSYAEIAAAVPRNGGEYRLLGRIYHPAVGFAAGIVSLVVGFSAPLAASALAFGHYLSAVRPGVPPVAAALAILTVLSALHASDVRSGGWFQALATGAQLLLIAGLVVCGAWLGDPSRLAAPGARSAWATIASPPFAVALVLVSFAYSGWNCAAYVAGELRTPARSLPLALAGGAALVTLLYLGLNAAFMASAPAAELAGVVEVGHVAAAKLLGPGAGRLVSALVALVLASSVSAMIVAGPRVYEAMGRDYPALRVLSWRPRNGGPALSVALQALIAVLMVLTSGFGTLLAYVGFTLSIVAGLTVLGVFVLRVREPDLARPYRTWGYPVTPLVFLLPSGWMAWHALRANPMSSWAGLATVAVALALHAALARRRGPAACSALHGTRSDE